MPGETIDDPVFGELTWDERGVSLLGTVALTPKHPVTVLIDREDPEDAPLGEAALAACRDAYQRVRDNEYGYRLGTAALVLPAYNGAWREPDSEEETQESFARKLELGWVHLFPSGRATLWYFNPDESLFPEEHVLMGFLDAAGTVASWKLS